ncbi:MAG: M1 family aminopeptidase, partial [Planctomycetota bacterium]
MVRPTSNLRSVLLIAALQAAAGTALAQHDETHHLTGCGKAEALAQLFAAGLSPTGEGGPGGGIGSREAMTDTDVLNNFVDFEIVPGPNTISGSNTMTVTSLVNGLSTFTFMLRSNFTITDIKLNGVTTLTAVSTGSYGRQVTFPVPFNAGDTFTLKITYNGTAVSRGFGSIEFQTQAGIPIVCSLSEPYYAGTWWPAKDGDFAAQGDNSDKATFDMWVTAPNNLVTASNGLLQGTDALAGNRKRYRWHTGYPTASYLACFSSTNYNTWTTTYNYPLAGGGTGAMPVQFFIYPQSDSAGNRAAWEKVSAMMATFRPLFGEYPFVNEKYGIYQFVFGGGMEHQTMTGQGTFNEGVTAHELGHQWWGDNVTCRTWGDIWLNEGFATYAAVLWNEFKPTGSSSAASQMAGIRPSTTSGSPLPSMSPTTAR